MVLKRVLSVSFFVLLVLPVLIFGNTSWSEPVANFNITPNVTRLNWTNSFMTNLTFGVNSTWNVLDLNVDERTSPFGNTIFSNYSQSGIIGSYESDNCGLGSTVSFLLHSKNSTGHETILTPNITQGGSAKMLIFANETCPPGRYWGHLNITGENSSYFMPLEINIPIYSGNELNETAARGYFRGELPANPETYHSYYFNTSLIDGANTVSISLNSDLDLFLLDSSGNLKAKNIQGNSEKLEYQYLPDNEFWEVRVFGDVNCNTAYTGTISFSTLNITYQNGTDISSRLDFGKLNVSDFIQRNITVKNDGSINYTSLTETKELYHTEHISASDPANFSIRMPDFITSIFVSANWTGSANYTISLYDPGENLVGVSSGGYFNANISSVMQEEYTEDSTGVGLSDDGYWRVEVLNNTNKTSPYTLNIKRWVDENEWINTNFTPADINYLGHVNDSVGINFNLTVQNKTLGGNYLGSLKYSSGGSSINFPFSFNITTGELMINSSFNSSSISRSHNLGFNRTVIIPINVRNTGNSDISLYGHTNSSYLNSSSEYMKFVYSLPSSISPGDTETFYVNVTVNTSLQNTTGYYEGWIMPTYYGASPYDSFNISLVVDLTNKIFVYLRNFNTESGDKEITAASSDENVTLKIETYLANGTEYTGLEVENFTSVKIYNKNKTSWSPTITFTDLKEHTSGSFFRAAFGQYWLNATYPGSSSILGGYYDVNVTASLKKDSYISTGEGTNDTFVINNPALWLAKVDNLDLDEGDSGTVNLTVTNYGPKTATGEIALEDKNTHLSVDQDDLKSGCGSKGRDDEGDWYYFNISISEGETCWYTWEIDAGEIDEDTVSVDLDVNVDDPSFNDIDFTIDINDISTSGDDSTGTSQTTSTVNRDLDIKKYPSSLSVEQGASKEFIVEVMNDGNADENNIIIEIQGISSSWYEYEPNDLDLIPNEDDEFTVNLTVPLDANVKEYSLTINVSNDNVYDSKSSTLIVLPSENEKERVNTSYSEYLENYTQLENKMKLLSQSGENVTEMNHTLNQIKTKIDQMKNYIDNDDYYNAAQMENEIKSLIVQAGVMVSSAGGGDISKGVLGDSKNYVWLFVGVIVIIIAGFVVYLFLPPPKNTYYPKKYKYKKPGTKKPIGERLSKRIIKIKKNLSKIGKNKKK